MTYKFSCPECGNHISASSEYAGTRAKCPHCSAEFTVPAPETNEAKPPAPPPLLTTPPAPKDATRPCPMCGEEILASARKCKHCGEYLDESGQPVGTETAGEKPPAGKSKALALGCLSLIVALAVAALLFWHTHSKNSAPPGPPAPAGDAASGTSPGIR